MSRGIRREALGMTITALDTLGDWFALGEAATHAVCERLCERLDLIPAGVKDRHAISHR